MANTDFNSVLSGSGTINRAGLLQALEKRGAYVVASGENPASLTPGNVTTICFNGVLFWYDSADATTVHDGVACIVTSDGKRFKSDGLSGANSAWYAVIDKDLATPPAIPAIGDKYIVATAGTGAWAAKDKYIAIYTARGWVFIVPKAFDYAYVIDEALIYHYSAGGVWTSGIPASTIATASISPSKIKYFPLGIAVENQTMNTPPGSPSDGVAYVISGAPTGAWLGHSLKVAIYETSAWVFYVPYEGATVYDKNLNGSITYDGAVWNVSISGYSKVASVFTAALENSNNLTINTNIFSATVAPTISASNHLDGVDLNYTAKAVGKILEIEYSCALRGNIVTYVSGSDRFIHDILGLQIDTTVAMTDWVLVAMSRASLTSTGSDEWQGVKVTFRITTTDTLPHDYFVRHFVRYTETGSGSAGDIDIARRSIIIREIS